MKPFLNVDAGEHDDEPDAIYALAHAVSVACGGHAGDRASMTRVIRACRAHGTRIGAHPSYDDRAGFGRRALDVTAGDVARSVKTQCLALAEVARDEGAAVGHMKPHGALYHAANRDSVLARAVVAAAKDALGPVAIVGPPRGCLVEAAREAGLPYLREGFADRATRSDGSLVPRGEPGAVLTDPIAARSLARALVLGGEIDTLCVHGDTPGAVVIARVVREELDGRE